MIKEDVIPRIYEIENEVERVSGILEDIETMITELLDDLEED